MSTHVEAALARVEGGETITPADLERAERADAESARAAAISLAQAAAQRAAAERAEIAALHEEANDLRAAHGSAIERLLAVDVLVDAAMAEARAALAEREAAILAIASTGNLARLFDAESQHARMLRNATLAKLRPDQRPRVGLNAHTAPERVLDAALLIPGFGETVTANFPSLTARDASLFGRPVPAPKPGD